MTEAKPQSAEYTDYTKLENSELLTALGTDALKWATAFVQYQHKVKEPFDEGWVLGWFANAMMAKYDHARRANEAEFQKQQATIDAQAAQIKALTEERGRLAKTIALIESNCWADDMAEQIETLTNECDELKAAQWRIMPNTYTVEVPEIGNKADPFEGPKGETYYDAYNRVLKEVQELKERIKALEDK